MDQKGKRLKGEEVILPIKEIIDRVTSELDWHFAEDHTVTERFAKAHAESVRF